ncbi:DUF2637 domain-containing protein [Micrococcus luteus]|nr:DUF2637 domain-containing protein [Micrococcus luteus]
MSAQQMWDARTLEAEKAESPSSGPAVGDSWGARSEAMHFPKNTVAEHSQTSTGGPARGEGVRSLPRRVNPNDGRFIRAVVAGTAVAGLVAFSISFAALYEVAAWLGLPAFMHWAVPVFIDLAILVYAGSVLVHESRGESARASWWALGAFTGLSMIANGAHAWSTDNGSMWQSMVGALIAVMVPVAVFVATDQLARVAVENPDSRRAERASLASEEAEELRAQAELDRQRADLEAEFAASRRQIESQKRQAEREAEMAEARHRRELESVERESGSMPPCPVPASDVETEDVRSLQSRLVPASEGALGPASVVAVGKPSGSQITAWIVARAEAGQVPSAAEVAEQFGCSERTGRRRLADAREANAEVFEAEEERA